MTHESMRLTHEKHARTIISFIIIIIIIIMGMVRSQFKLNMCINRVSRSENPRLSSSGLQTNVRGELSS